ncbi:Uu.00g010960.m01.CDS01 [Anthostomella pinea]|uniref:Uu.00g010960.m01.CDS01 n=1 Tax=Anthostomella pinea TaxID=933095 RepID=A0AAI8YMR7_9PEZI|nr:Uu.00g010960.m01.CDS01 [Anthostomella pinea]
MEHVHTKPEYQPLAKDEEDQSYVALEDQKRSRSQTLRCLAVIACFFLTAIGCYFAGRLSKPGQASHQKGDAAGSTAPQISVPGIVGEFVFKSPFSQEPPQGEGAGDASEPIWDALIPNGVGYFRDGDLAPKISIPTVFHQLHCLYVLRRAYYTRSGELQRFDFGKNRTIHAAHCFDYLEQSITCAADSTVEPAEDDANGFLGSGFPRQCRDFEALKDYVERWRVFNATGFLAHGLEHGQVHIDRT